MTNDLIRQTSNEALVSLVLPMLHEAIYEAAACVAHDCDIGTNEAQVAIEAQFLKYVASYPQHALNLDILSIWTGYHPDMDYQAPFTPNEDSGNDDISPYGDVAA